MFRFSVYTLCSTTARRTALTHRNRLPIIQKARASDMSSILKTAQTTLAENFGGPAAAAAPTGTQFSIDQVPDQSGKVAVITGGSEGIGYGVSHTLLSKVSISDYTTVHRC